MQALKDVLGARELMLVGAGVAAGVAFVLGRKEPGPGVRESGATASAAEQPQQAQQALLPEATATQQDEQPLRRRPSWSGRQAETAEVVRRHSRGMHSAPAAVAAKLEAATPEGGVAQKAVRRDASDFLSARATPGQSAK